MYMYVRYKSGAAPEVPLTYLSSHLRLASRLTTAQYVELPSPTLSEEAPGTSTSVVGSSRFGDLSSSDSKTESSFVTPSLFFYSVRI